MDEKELEEQPEQLRLCKNCLYAGPGERHHTCRKHPPRVIAVGTDAMADTYWPEVGEHDFCWEFKRRKKDVGGW